MPRKVSVALEMNPSSVSLTAALRVTAPGVAQAHLQVEFLKRRGQVYWP